MTLAKIRSLTFSPLLLHTFTSSAQIPLASSVFSCSYLLTPAVHPPAPPQTIALLLSAAYIMSANNPPLSPPLKPMSKKRKAAWEALARDPDKLRKIHQGSLDTTLWIELPLEISKQAHYLKRTRKDEANLNSGQSEDKVLPKTRVSLLMI
jgi:hypothetical protein